MNSPGTRYQVYPHVIIAEEDPIFSLLKRIFGHINESGMNFILTTASYQKEEHTIRRAMDYASP